MEDNKRKLYDALSEDYDLGSFEQFSTDIQDDTKRRKLYDATVEEYDYGDYDSFSEQLGFGPGQQQAQQEQPQAQEAASPSIDEVKGRKTLNVSRNPAMDEAYRQAVTPEQPVEQPVEQSAAQAPSQKKDFGVPNYFQEGAQAAAEQPKPSLETEKTTAERNLDAINQKLAEDDFPEVKDENGNAYKIVAASGVEDDGTIHFAAKDKDGIEVELTAKDYADFMPDDSVEGRNKRQMEADRAEIERLNRMIAARKEDKSNRRDEDFVGPVMDKKASKEARKDLEAQKQRALYRLDNNPEYQKAIEGEKKRYGEQMQELDAALQQSGGGLGGRTVEEVYSDFNPNTNEGDARGYQNEQVYNAAARMLQDAQDIMSTGLRYADDTKKAEFLRAAGKDMANPDFWTMGLTDIIDNVTFRNVMERYANQALSEFEGKEVEDPVSPIEEKLVEAYLTRANAMAIRSEDQSQGSKMGKGAAESLKFMIDMALSGGLGKAVTKGAAEAFTRKAINKFGRKLASMGTETGLKTATKAAVKEAGGLGIKLAGDVIETVPKVALSPLTAQSVAEQAAQFNSATGRFDNSWGKSLLKGTAAAGIEKFSELHGGIYEKAAKNIFKVSGANALYKKLVSEDLRKTFSDWAKKTSTGAIGKAFAAGEWDGLFEMAEEMENAAMYQLLGEKDAWSDFWTRDNWLEMLGSFAPMTVFGMAANAGQNIYTRNKFEKTLGVLGNMGFNTDALRDVARTSSVKDLAAYLSEGLGSVQNGALVGTIEGIALGAEDKKKAANAVKDFMKAAVRMQALDGIYQGQQEQRMEDKKAEIQEAVAGKQFWKDDGTVEIADLATGEQVYVVSAPGRDGRVAVLHMDGTPGYITIDDLAEDSALQSEYGDELSTGNEPARKRGTTVMPLDEYLSLRVQTDRQNEEAGRMETERQQQVGDVASQYQRGQQVEYPRGNEMKKGQVYDTSDPDTMIIVNDDGTFDYVPWEEVAAWTGQTVNVQTDDEQAQGIAGLLEAGDDARSDMAESIDAGIGPGVTVQGADGNTYEVLGFDKDSVDIEKGTARFTVRDADGVFLTMELPYADFVKSGAENAAAAAQAEADRLAEEQAAAEEERRRLEAEARQKAEEEAKRKKEPEYMDRLIDENPQQFARLNDEQNQDGGADTRELFQKKIDELTAQVEDLGRRRSESSVPSERKALADEAGKLRERIAGYRAVMDSYEAKEGGEAPAPAEPAPVQPQQPPQGPQSPAGGGAVLMTPQERKDAAKKAAQEQMGEEAARRVEKFMSSRRIQGRQTMRKFGGKMRKAHYVLVEADAPIPSHDALNGFAPISANSRAYEEAQQKDILRNAQRFNSDALHDMPTLRQDGLVPEGNGRTMMSQLAAANHEKGWDKDYLDVLEYEAETYGFTPEQLASFEHPRVYIMFDEGEDIELTAKNMHASNLDEKKGESKAQVSTRMSKLLNESPRAREVILDEIYSQMEFDPTRTENGKAKIPQLTDVAKKPGVVASILKALVAAGAITESNIANYVNERDNTGNKAFTELVENILLGMAFDQESLNILLDYEYSNNEAIQRAIARASALMAARLCGYFGEEYDMTATLNNAVELLYRAAKFAEASKLPATADAVEEYLNDTTALFAEGVTFDEGTVALARLIWNTKRETNGRTLYETLGNLIDQIGRIVNSKENAGGMFADMEEIDYESLQDLIKRTIFEKAGIKSLDNGQSAENAAPAGAQQQGPRVGEENESEDEQPVQPGNVGSTVEAAPEEPAAEPAEAPAAEPEPVEAEAPKTGEFGSGNKYFTKDKLNEGLEELRRARGKLNAGIDWGILPSVMKVLGYYVEAGVRKFADVAKVIIQEVGDFVKPYLKGAYKNVRSVLENEPYFNELSTDAEVDATDLDALTAPETSAEPAPEQPKPAAKPKAEKPKKAKKATVESIFAEATGQETPAEEGSDEDFGGLFAQPIDNQENNSENSRISEKESLDLQKKALGIDKSDYRTYMTPAARQFFEELGRGKGWAQPELSFISFASVDQVIIPLSELEKLPEVIAAEEKIKEVGRRAKEETGKESLSLTDEEVQAYAQRLLSDENGSFVSKKDSSGPVAREKKAYIVIGRPAGGKSSVFAEPLSKEHKARIIDSDTVKPWLPGYDGGNGANYVNAASARVADEALMQAAALGENIVIPKIGGTSIINEIAVPLRLAGYSVELCFNEVTEEASIMRAASRFAQTGRYLSLQYLKSIGDKPLNTFKKFAEKSINEAVDELSEKQVQELRRRAGRLLGEGGEYAGAIREAGDRGGQEEVDGNVRLPLGERGSARVFDSAVWKNNVVDVGNPPITVWESESGKPMPGTEQAKGTEEEARKAFRDTVRDALLKAVETGEKPYIGITQLRQVARDAGMEVEERGATDALIQELVEDAIVRAARILNGDGLISGKSAKERYDSIVKLYEMQPPISQRSSERVAKQQYSTPLPMGFLADMFAWDMDREVLEPTAGTGMMVINVPAAKVHANEIDPVRLEILRGMGFAEVTDQDATEPFPADRKYGTIIANPPFGSSGQEKTFDGKTFTKLEHIIALNALEAMKPDGKAAIIVGGNMEYNPNGSIKTDAKFWHFLYDHYNVKGVIDMDGKLYGRQGTTYPTRLILIDGKRDPWERMKNTVFAPVKDKAPRKAETFDDLYDIVNEISKSDAKTNGYVRSEGEVQLPDNSNASGSSETGGRPGESRPAGDNVGAGAERGAGRRGSARTEGSNESAGTQQENGGSVGRPLRSGVAADVAEAQPGPDNGQDTSGGGDLFGADREGESGGNAGGPVSAEVLGTDAGVGSQRPQRVEEKRELSSDKLHYVQHSGAFSLESVAPAPMVEAMDEALKRIEQEYGPIDSFVQKELGYSTKEELYSALAAEQVDSVAMAIYQMKNGQAMIIGDQTGVGKGRQMAALIRWAVKQGKKPIFVTQKAGLFSDMYRDLADIGSANLVPFIFNADGDMTYEDKDGNMVVAYKHASPTLLQQAFDKGELPEGCHYAIITYSQVSSGDAQSRAEAKKKNGGRAPKKSTSTKATPKADFLRKIAKGNYLLMDESHTAAGESNTGAYFQSLIKDAAGVTFASATFAKRPDTMPLYALRTSMSQANVSTEELIASINKGGVALQEIMSRALTQTGQMVRRERDMSDVVTDWITIEDPETVQRAKENYDKTIEAFNAIIRFQEDYVRPAIESIAGTIAATGGNATGQRGTEKLGIDNTPFASKTYNYTKQLMLALKAEAVVDKVIEEIEAGRHPVIALESTMESGLKEEGYSAGDQVQDVTFASSLLRGLDSTMRYAIKDSDGVIQAATLTPEELGPAGEAEYYRLQDMIREFTAGVFASPLDLITMRLQDAGYKVGELTGRSLVVQRGENGGYVIATRDDSNKAKKKAAADFNSGKLDVLILNKAASTGISLHAFKKFKDQRQRTMILAQPMSDINDYMQMIGRIDRTGQVHRGYYINLSLPVAAEQRFNMMLSTKLKSLNANTAADQEGGGSVEAVDLLNKYGDQVVIEYLRDHPDIYEKLGSNALKTAATGGKYVEPSELDEYQPKEGDARRITGRVALLNTREQEEFYDDVIERYNALIQYLDDTGSNDLKITTVPLRAETISRKVSSKGVNPEGDNPFAKDAYVETVEMDNLRKPMKAEEVKATIERLNGGLYDGPKKVRKLTTIVDSQAAAKTDAENERYAKAKAKLVEDIRKFSEKVMARKGQSEEEKQKAIDEYVQEQTEKVDGKHEDNILSISTQSSSFNRRLNMFQVGATYLVPDQLGENLAFMSSSPAIFCGFKAKEDKMTPSTTYAVFAVLDGRRKVELKLSQRIPLELIRDHSRDNWGRTREVNLDNWDEKYVNTARKKGHIMTGNILQAIADTQDEFGNFPGQLVSYTDIDGNIHDGILMPDNWTPGQLRSSGVPINTKLQNLLRGEDVTSADGKVEIVSYYGPAIEIRVPKSKKEGGKYFENTELTSLSRYGGGFHTYRGKMEMSILGEENIRKALDILSGLGVRVADESEEQETTRQTRFRDGSSGEDVRYRIREDEPPTKTGIGYKVFYLPNAAKLALYPPMVANPDGESTPTSLWLDADAAPVARTTVTGRQQVKAGGKGTQGGSGTLSYRPGWHLGEIPYAIQFNRLDENGEKTLFPKNFVWAEVEYAADFNYQQEAMSYGMKESGKFQHSLAGLPYLPKDGFYTYRTNPNPETDPWIITGAMRVKRLLTPTEVDAMVTAAGRQPQPRQAGAITDAQIEKLNQEIERRAQVDPEVMDGYINDLAANLGVKVKVVRNVNEIKDQNEAVQRRKRRSKGYYDLKTGQIVLVLPNAESVADAEATVFHEGVGHEGMRGMFGEKFDKWLDDVYENAEPGMKSRIDAMRDSSISDKKEQTREATEEYIAEMAERGVEDNLEMSFWDRVKAMFRQFARAMGIRLNFTDADIRYNLWKSKRYLAKKGESVMEKADRVATDQQLRREAEASYRAAAENDENGPEDDNTPPVGDKPENKNPKPNGNTVRFRTSPELSRSSRVLRDRAITNDTQDVALRMYGNEVMLGRNIVRELLVDMNTAVRTAMRAIEEESGKEATAKEDVTKALNQLSSKQQAASERYANGFLKPLMETVAKVAEEMDVEFEDIIQYVSLRRALEANELYAKRDAKEYYQRKHDDAVIGVESRTDIDRAAKDALIHKLDADLQNQLNDTDRGMSDKYRELRGTDGKHEGKDYGATVSWFSEYVDKDGNRSDTVPAREPGEDNMSYQRRLKGMRKPMAGAETLAGAEDLASQYIHDFETRAGGLARELWDKINAATGEILRIQYDSHLITREQYDDIRSRSQYYVPLRGFADMTAEDAFSYVTDDLSDTFVPALMRAGGRISRPDSPFGFIAGMAASTINEAYKNMAVQYLYRFIANRKDNSLAVISDSWYVPTGRMVTMADVAAGDARMEDLGKEIWEPAYPDLSSPDMAGQEASMQTFSEDMEQKALMGQAAKGTAGLNLRNAFVFNKKANEKQHFVRVKVLGQEKFIIFRGDPRAAQAINGILNPDTRNMGAWSRGVRSVARTMAKLCTSYSVPFWFSNFFRDGQTAVINTYEKEGAEYAGKMITNIPFALGVISAHVKGGDVHIKDSWSDAKKNRVKRLYDEYQKYASGGAITGYSVIFNHAEYDKQFKRAIREKKSDLAEMWSWIGDMLESIGTVSEGIEQVFRFATFITSREAGRPMEQCIDDAKNVTVNFNRKGSYAAMEWKDTARITSYDKKSGMYSTLGDKGGVAATAERAFIWFLSQVAPWVRTRFMFVNPNIQGTYTTYSNWKVSALRTASAIFGVAWTSFLIHVASELLVPDPDDRDREKRRKLKYSHLTDYQRRSNIILPELGGVRVTIPLSQEYAPFWAIGDIMASAALKEKYDQKAAWEVAKALGEIAPVNVFDPTNIVPDPLRPTLEAVTNTNYQGRNIFQKLYNETTPDFKRAYNGTWEPLVDLSVALNRAMGGTESVTPEGYGKTANVRFRWNNPAAWQHIIEGMGGTTVSALGDVMELAEQLVGPADVKLSSVPIVNRFVKDPYEWGNDWYLNTEATKFKNLSAEQNKRRKALEKAGETQALQRLLESDNWAITDLYDRQYKSAINKLEKQIRELKGSYDADDKIRLSQLQQDLETLQSALIKDVKNLLKDRK